MTKAVEGPRVALVIGDPAGIGPELAAKLLAQGEIVRPARTLVIGDRRVLAQGARVAGVELEPLVVEPGQPLRIVQARPTLLDLANLDPDELETGRASAGGGGSVLANFGAALALAREGAVDAICFTPFNKHALKLAGSAFEDEISFAASELGHRGLTSEFNILEGLWNARVTSHVPLRRVAELITEAAILDALQLTQDCLSTAGVLRPRIAVAALNPHAGDGGNFGREEIDVIEPAVAAARARQWSVDGPFPADTVFLRARNGGYDAVLTMYHDQGQIAMKLMGFERGVTLLGGLAVPITTPAHGSAYDIAGRGIAAVGATLNAFALACRLAAPEGAGGGNAGVDA
ncbi:MAG: 4-hydroxythreonine-4-phosphate dehydrogenase PdxA [Proteobacteria bacterium]|nr:4-hydroxythreonine-4-phosphate dehydrogenase PdxA [Pseudomonadota bacterium]MBI3505660.1 4-hydroxythreonine-4-phosphate dehydrogenase PdxA [Pseudomonadota bacterium]